MHQHGELASQLFLRLVVAQPLDAVFGFLQSIIAYQIPWALWHKEAADHERHGPNPLQCEGNTIGPLVRPVDQTFQHASRNKLADGPAEVDEGGHIATQVGWTDLRRIRWADSREDTPGKSAEDLAD